MSFPRFALRRRTVLRRCNDGVSVLRGAVGGIIPVHGEVGPNRSRCRPYLSSKGKRAFFFAFRVGVFLGRARRSCCKSRQLGWPIDPTDLAAAYVRRAGGRAAFGHGGMCVPCGLQPGCSGLATRPGQRLDCRNKLFLTTSPARSHAFKPELQSAARAWVSEACLDRVAAFYFAVEEAAQDAGVALPKTKLSEQLTSMKQRQAGGPTAQVVQAKPPHQQPFLPAKGLDFLDSQACFSRAPSSYLLQEWRISQLWPQLSRQRGCSRAKRFRACSSSYVGSKGVAKRERRQSALAVDFYLAVLQAAAKLLRPASPVPPSLDEFSGQVSMCQYLQRFGYAGDREIAYTMWCLAQELESSWR